MCPVTICSLNCPPNTVLSFSLSFFLTFIHFSFQLMCLIKFFVFIIRRINQKPKVPTTKARKVVQNRQIAVRLPPPPPILLPTPPHHHHRSVERRNRLFNRMCLRHQESRFEVEHLHHQRCQSIRNHSPTTMLRTNNMEPVIATIVHHFPPKTRKNPRTDFSLPKRIRLQSNHLYWPNRRHVSILAKSHHNRIRRVKQRPMPNSPSPPILVNYLPLM